MAFVNEKVIDDYVTLVIDDPHPQFSSVHEDDLKKWDKMQIKKLDSFIARICQCMT